MKALAVLLLLFAPFAFGADTASSNNEAYYQQLVTLFTNVILRLSFLISIVILFVTCVLYALKTFDENSLSKRDLKPMSFVRFLAGIALASLLFAPINSMRIFNDLTGLYIKGDPTMSVCSAVEIDVKNFDWGASGQNCIQRAEERFNELIRYQNDARLSDFNFGLVFGVIQLIAIGFMINSGITLAKHIWGFRNIKTSVSGALVAMTMASVVFSSPNIVAYVQDLRGGDSAAINSGIE